MSKYYWIKERHNPQLGVYYVPYGNTITVKEAKRMENSLYGDNYMHRFSSEEEYKAEIERLKEKGERVK